MVRSSIRARCSALPLVSRVCAVTGAPLLCWIVWVDLVLVMQPTRRVDDGVGQGLLTIFLGPTALLFVLATVTGAVWREGAARVVAYCGVLWPVLVTIAYFAAFTFY